MTDAITVLQPGLSVLQDLGRPGASRVGQMSGGALDQYGASVANTLVGNPVDAPLVEIVAFDFCATTTVDRVIAVTGAVADVTIDGLPQEQWEPIVWLRGQKLWVRGISSGIRVYLGVHGRLDAGRLLGSCAPDTVLGFGDPLRAGATLTVEDDCPVPRHHVFGVPFFRLGADRHPARSPWEVDVTDGPDIAEFGGSLERLTDTVYTVGASSNHIGLRLAPNEGSPPQRDRRTEILSRGVPIGAVEVPDGNEILVLHRGRGVTAGYPVLAVVTATGLSRLGQAGPGDQVRFRRVTVEAAVVHYRDQQRRLEQLRDRVRNVFAAQYIPTHFDAPVPTSARPTTAWPATARSTTERIKESA
jgi:biotin-dependent carboxylase-like uncharacterized protein